jgi:hypothetical protein
LFDGFVASAIAVADGRQPELGPRTAARPREVPVAAPGLAPTASAPVLGKLARVVDESTRA